VNQLLIMYSASIHTPNHAKREGIVEVPSNWEREDSEKWKTGATGFITTLSTSTAVYIARNATTGLVRNTSSRTIEGGREPPSMKGPALRANGGGTSQETVGKTG
jgi:hypothetical protein